MIVLGGDTQMSRKQKRPTRASPVIDVVIVTGGRFDMLEVCLKALYREAQEVPISLTIVDNASPAEERIQNSHLFDNLDGNIMFYTKRLQQGLGFAEANNDGARNGKSPLILFLNDDVELFEGTLKKIVDDFQKIENLGVLGIKLMFPPTSTSPIRPAGKVQHVGLSLDINGEVTHPLMSWSPTNPKTCVSRDVWAVTGACFTVRRDAFNKVGGFDKIYGLGTFEEVDLCLKVRQLGYRIYVDTDAQGYHYVGATAEKLKKNFPIQENKMIFQSRWLNSGLMVWDNGSYW